MVELEPSGCDGAATLLVSGLVLADADAGSVACAAAWWSALLAAHIPMVEIEPSAGAACTAWIIAVDLPAKTSTRCCIYPTPKPIYPTPKLIYIHFSDKKSLLPPCRLQGGCRLQMMLTGMMMMEERGMRTAGSSSVFFRPCRRNSSCLKFESPPHCYRAQYYPLLCTLPHNVCVCSNLVCITAQCIPLQQCIPMHVNSVQIGRHSPQILSWRVRLRSSWGQCPTPPMTAAAPIKLINL